MCDNLMNNIWKRRTKNRVKLTSKYDSKLRLKNFNRWLSFQILDYLMVKENFNKESLHIVVEFYIIEILNN